VLQEEVLAAVTQLSGHIPAERDVPLHDQAEGGAQMQVRDGVAEPETGRAAGQVQIAKVEQQHGHHSRERHVQRTRRQACVPRRAV